MHAVTPVNVHVEGDWHGSRHGGSYVKKSTTPVNRGERQSARMRTCVTNKTKTLKTKPSQIPQPVVQPKQVVPVSSRSPSPNRDRWVPPPGRSTKLQKFSWQGSKGRLEINSTIDNIVSDDVGDEDSQTNEHDKQNQQSQIANVLKEQDEKLQNEIQTYEKRIQGLIENVGMLKERARNRLNQEQADQLREDINSSIRDLEQSQRTTTTTTANIYPSRLSQSSPPSRDNHRSASADEQRNYRATSKVSFKDDPLGERRRARSTTPVRGPIYLNPDRERLLISLSESEADISQITKQLSSVKDILIKLKLDDQPISFEVEQLRQHRNQLLHLIEQFEYSNNKLKDFIRHQYHLEAEHGIINEKNDTILTRIHELESENGQIRRLLLDRENDNIALQTELERIRTHAIGFDTMKTSLEQNRAHLQRELYAKEGEINRLQCGLRSLERDLQRSRHQCDNLHRSIRRTPMFPNVSSSTAPAVVAKTKGLTVEKLQAQLMDRDRQIEELEREIYADPNELLVDAQSEIVRLRTKLEHAERLVGEYKEQLHTQTLKASVDNSKTHLSEIDFEKMRVRLQKRLEELEPLPEYLRQAEMKNQELETRLLEQDRRLADQSSLIHELTSKMSSQNQIIDRINDSNYSFDDDYRGLQQKIDGLQRQMITLEEDNGNLLRNLSAKEEALRNAQSRLNAKSYELASMNKQISLTQTDIKAREDSFGSKERLFQQRVSDLEQQISKLRLECTQLKREKDEVERRYTSQLGELRDKLEQSNNNNRSMQNYVNSLKTTYASVFNDTLPPPFTTTSLTQFTKAPSIYP
ncbi:unnamed protein product [Rotaria magnacalcarata]|uniref:Uncharacterized protein n=4 Tax=Rotaria magnacalcarata TaxID=392030 RepID=A0A817A5I9_9BILA|nr:unnamed protein product [Rotaria magnacalcarata]CAF2255048.1 unnamed protein product [Rotaria magnacalcarata]